MQQKPKKSILRKLFVILITLGIIGIIAIGIYAQSLITNPEYITLGIGESYTLTPRESEFQIRSYHAEVISPDTGSSIKATAIGNAVVGVKYNYFDRDFYRFVVIEEPKSITLSHTELTLGECESYNLHAKSTSGTHEFNATYQTDNENVATVTDDGKVSAVGAGECTITASTYNGVSSKCKVTVMKSPTKLKLSKSSVTLGKGEETTLSPVFPKGEYCHDVVLSSSDEKVASIKNNVLKANSVGTCTITAKAHNGMTAECKVTVKKMAESVTLTVLPKYDIDAQIRVLTSVPKDSAAYNVELSVSDESILAFDEKKKNVLHPKLNGECTITATLSNGVTASKTVTIGDYKKSSMSFKILNQFPSLPTGCEVVSLTSVLNHYGEDISMNTMAEKYMPTKKYNYFSVSPHDYFLGTPYSFDSGMGCFSGCIVKTANNYFKDKKIDDYVAVDITGCTTDELYNFLNNQVPVITWVTSGFVTPTNDATWKVKNETITWCNHEHCLVTTGYDKDAGTVTVADDSGGYSYTVSMSQYEKVFKGMGSMAVVVLKK